MTTQTTQKPQDHYRLFYATNSATLLECANDLERLLGVGSIFSILRFESLNYLIFPKRQSFPSNLFGQVSARQIISSAYIWEAGRIAQWRNNWDRV